jgi:hypothetical protein
MFLALGTIVGVGLVSYGAYQLIDIAQNLVKFIQ